MIGQFRAALGYVALLAASPQVHHASAEEPIHGGRQVSLTAADLEAVGSDAVDLLLLTEPHLHRVRIEVRFSGGPLSSTRNSAIQSLFGFADIDGDHSISREEGRFLPTTQTVRQFAWGEFFPFAARESEFAILDTDRNGFVTMEELAAHYRAASLGELSVQLSAEKDLPRLDASLLAGLDRDGDDRLDAGELRQAEELLSRLDADQDEVLTRAEVLQNASGLLRDGGLPTGSPQSPFVILRPAGIDRAWIEKFAAACGLDGTPIPRDRARLSKEATDRLDRDSDGMLSADELDGLRLFPPDEYWIFDLDSGEAGPVKHPARNGRLTETGGYRLELLPREGLIGKRWPAFETSLEERFQELDVDQDRAVSAEEALLPHRIDFPQVVAAADRDGDGRLTVAELRRWLTVQRGLVPLHTRLDVTDRGRSLFDLLDANGDELLSVRELRTAADRLAKIGLASPPLPLTANAAHRIRVTVSCGKSVPSLNDSNLAAPDWFRAMDRNRDGDLSRREFSGPAAAFLKLDRNEDGLISPDETFPPDRTEPAAGS